jgi:hypothetical protein
MNNKHRSCASHCCVIRGCKYGYEDCPVVNGEVIQEYVCEDCSPGIKDINLIKYQV